MSTHPPDRRLQAKLRGMIEADGVIKVSALLAVSRATLACYLADCYLHTITLRGVEDGIDRARFDGMPRERLPPTKLQVKLRAMIFADGFRKVCEQLDTSRETLARYLADLALQESSFRGIEASVAAAPVPVNAPRRATKGGRVHAL